MVSRVFSAFLLKDDDGVVVCLAAAVEDAVRRETAICECDRSELRRMFRSGAVEEYLKVWRMAASRVHAECIQGQVRRFRATIGVGVRTRDSQA